MHPKHPSKSTAKRRSSHWIEKGGLLPSKPLKLFRPHLFPCDCGIGRESLTTANFKFEHGNHGALSRNEILAQ